MHILKMNSLSHQRGGFLVTVLILVMVGMMLTVALKIVPGYMGNRLLKHEMATIMATPEYKSMTLDDIRAALSKAMEINPVDGFDGKFVVITQQGSKEYVDINYEIRTSIAANVSTVVEFKNRFDKN